MARSLGINEHESVLSLEPSIRLLLKDSSFVFLSPPSPSLIARLGSSQKMFFIVPYFILFSIYQTQIAAQTVIPAQNVIRYYTTTSPFLRASTISIRVCVYVTLTRHRWLPFQHSSHSPNLYLFSRSLNALPLFFCLSYVVSTFGSIIIIVNTFQAQGCAFLQYPACISENFTESRSVYSSSTCAPRCRPAAQLQPWLERYSPHIYVGVLQSLAFHEVEVAAAAAKVLRVLL